MTSLCDFTQVKKRRINREVGKIFIHLCMLLFVSFHQVQLNMFAKRSADMNRAPHYTHEQIYSMHCKWTSLSATSSPSSVQHFFQNYCDKKYLLIPFQWHRKLLCDFSSSFLELASPTVRRHGAGGAWGCT